MPSGLVVGEGGYSVGVRPEKVRLLETSETPPPGMNVAPGVVRDTSYLGVSTQYIVDLRSGEKVTVYEQNVARTARETLFDRGEEALVVWSPEHTFVVGGEEPPALEEDAA